MFTKIILYTAALLITTNICADANQDLVSAVINNQLQNVKAALDRNADVNTEDAKGLTPLIIAAINGRTDIVRELLTNPHSKDIINVNMRDNAHNSALIRAVRGSYTEIVQALLTTSPAKNEIDRQDAEKALTLTNNSTIKELLQNFLNPKR
jgi:ankyrin repeat protein